MRLFTAITLPDYVKDKLWDTSCQIKAHAQSGNFTSSNNYHITLVFLGETEANDITPIKNIINQACGIFPPMNLSSKGLGYFKKGNRKILYYDVGGDAKNLTRLQNFLYGKFYEAGLCERQNGYTPHITLARQVKTEDIPTVDLTVHFACGAITLMHSTRVNGKLTYLPIYSSSFSGWFTVDRAEGKTVVCEGYDGLFFNISKKNLPEGVSSGSIIRYNGLEYIIDEKKTGERSRMIREKFEKETGNH